MLAGHRQRDGNQSLGTIKWYFITSDCNPQPLSPTRAPRIDIRPQLLQNQLGNTEFAADQAPLEIADPACQACLNQGPTRPVREGLCRSAAVHGFLAPLPQAPF
jgi:hypothetical protein